MKSLNEVRLIGNLGRDAEVKHMQGGSTKVSFSLATKRSWKDKQTGEWKSETDWHNVILWRDENVASLLVKGAPVFVGGRIQTRQYEKDGERRYATEIVADNVIVLLGRDPSVTRDSGGASAPQPSEHKQPSHEITDDDLPF